MSGSIDSTNEWAAELYSVTAVFSSVPFVVGCVHSCIAAVPALLLLRKAWRWEKWRSSRDLRGFLNQIAAASAGRQLKLTMFDNA